MKPFLLEAAQMERSGPLGELGVAALHDGPGHDGEVLAAFLLAATIPTGLLGRVVLLVPQCGQTGPSGQRAASNHTRAASSSWKCGSANWFLAIGKLSYGQTLPLGACGVNYVIPI